VKGRWLEQAMLASGLGPPSSVPRDLCCDIPLALPLTIVTQRTLSAHAVRDWLKRGGLRHEVAERDRPLHGCLTARAGVGIIFLDADDHEHERRFTLAHEASHFVLDHLLPREQAIKTFGDKVRPVLDGLRRPTKEEALYSVLDRVPLGLQVRLMDRGVRGGVCAWSIEEAEQRADRLAFEMLAPARAVLESLRPLSRAVGSVPVAEAASRIAREFGLPANTAEAYAELLLGKQRSIRTSVLDLFGKR